MMQITLSPKVSKKSLTISKAGDVLTINGESFDFSTIPEDGKVPSSKIPCDLIDRDVTRIDGRIHVTIILPHFPWSSEAIRFPQPIIDPPDGDVAIPRDPEPEEPDNVEA